MRRAARLAIFSVAATILNAAYPATAEDRAADAFFEAKVRPVLVERCYSCHGPDKQTSDLRLDSRQAALKGGAEGPAVVPGEPEESLLVQAIRRDGHLRMPPKESLEEVVVRDLTEWVKMGAPWPATSGAKSAESSETGHWSFLPVLKPAVPASGSVHPIDAFLRRRLEEGGLTSSETADRRTLIRRLTFDLTGLPPAADEVDAFLADESPDAYEQLVDRLLASPRYGERWGRHWLDVARYADTKGYVFAEERRYPFSYTYRDYVIRAFNEDRPYDRFLVEQIAADQLPDAKPETLAALGFLTVGRRFLNVNEDIIDDRIDVVTRGLMGLTVTCARCHDHKYDPVPTEDYYSLFGVFASCVEPAELPVIGESSGQEAEAYAAARAEKQKVVEDYLTQKREEYRADLRSKAAGYLIAAFEMDFDPKHADFERRVRADDLRPKLLRHLMGRWKERADSASDPFFEAWRAFSALTAGEFAARAAEVAAQLAPPTDLCGPPVPDLNFRIVAEPPASMREVVGRYAELLRRAADPGTPAEPAVVAARALLDADGGPFAVTPDEVRRLFDRADRDRHRELERQLAQVDVEHPGAPPRAMVLNDRPQPVEPRVFIRGNPGRPGDVVPRHLPAVLAGPDRQPFQQGSGRLELARAIASADNPLTARVVVNRVWMIHFGEGLVGTPGDFGLRGDAPTHPELLDYLASRFVAEGWSIKRLHRLIVTSEAYKQRSDRRPECEAVDPQNRLLWRQNRRRLDFEAMRDSLLAVAGRLDGRMGGRSVPIAEHPSTPRRSVYGYVDRQNLDGLYRTFDFASPDSSTPRRAETTVPQQALFLMNSPFAAEQAAALAGRLGSIPADETGPRIERLYAILFGRQPEPGEVEAGREFVAAVAEGQGGEGDGDKLDPWAAYAQVLLETNEFLFLD